MYMTLLVTTYDNVDLDFNLLSRLTYTWVRDHKVHRLLSDKEYNRGLGLFGTEAALSLSVFFYCEELVLHFFLKFSEGLFFRFFHSCNRVCGKSP